MTTNPQDYDFVIVGGGSAGAIVATRLAEDPENKVLVLEAGPENTSYWSRVPLGFAKIIAKSSFKSYRTAKRLLLGSLRVRLGRDPREIV